MIVSGWAWITFSPIQPTESQTQVVDPAALLAPATTVPETGGDPALLLLAPPTPTSAPSPLLIVDCTVATCPDAVPYRVDYQGEIGPKGSATLRAACIPKDSKEKSPALGEVLQNTIVWVITSTIQPGKFEENGENRIGFIHPTKDFPNGGCISFTALHPYNP